MSNFNANFVENNFFSDDDWSGHHLNVSLGFSNSPECPDNDTESLLTNWSSGSSSHSPTMYIEHENETNMMDFNVEDLLKTAPSPPLTPDRNIDVDQLLMDSASNSHIQAISCEELMDDLNAVSTGQVEKAVPALLRIRSNSDESSSTSAYSSQSATPPPKPQAADAYENLFFSPSHAYQNPADEGFHEISSNLVHDSTHAMQENNNLNLSRKNSHSKSRKTTQKRQSPAFNCNEDTSDFDRKVEEALKETNRLLNMHKMEPCSPPKSYCKANRTSPVTKGDKPSVDLRELCDNTILNSQTQNTTGTKQNSNKHPGRKKGSSTKKVSAAEAILKELKRKASEKSKMQSTESSTTVPSSVIVTNLTPSNPTLVTQTCQIPLGTVVQAPLACTLSTSKEPPVKIIVKQEPASQLYLATTTSSNTPVTIIRTTGQNLIGKSSPSVVTPAPAKITKKAEIPLHSLVIKPEKPAATNSAPLNLSTNGQAAIKVVKTSSLSRLVSGNPTVIPKSNTGPVITNVKSIPKSTPKPLMVSQPAKKAIVPNGNAVYPTSIHLQSTITPTPKSSTIPLSNMDEETQNRVLKRQQRMIKNREWACQSRQRRKEYITMLEQRMSACVDDNNKLRAINTKLKERVNELEKENATLRIVAGASNAGQRKAACILMLVLFVGFNVNPLSFANWGRSNNMDMFGPSMGSNNTRQSWQEPVETGYHGRQLLAVVDQDGEGEKKDSAQINESRNAEFTKLQSRQDFWIDDMVKNYKKEHISKILEILQATSPIPMQRLLRRKLKEELGVRLPLPGSRTRRISYTPSRRNTVKNDFSISELEELSRRETKLPPPPPSVKHDDRLVSPCDNLGRSFDQPNQTDSARVSDHIAKWIEQHEDEQRKDEKTSVTDSKPGYKTLQNTKRKRREYTSPNRRNIKNSIPAVYEKKDQKLKRLLEAIERKNDTVYMISFSKDHILLPASVIDGTGHTKMSLVLPTVPPNDSFVTIDEAAMIQINCEVRSTNYVKIDRELLSSVGYPARNTKNDKYNNQQHSHENPKRRAYHGSKMSSAFEQTEKRKQPREKLLSQDEETTITEEMDL